MATHNTGSGGHRMGGQGHGGTFNERAGGPSVSMSVSDIKLAAPLSENLFADIAKEKAERVFESGSGSKNKSTQLRKFYDELVMWFEKVNLERTREAKSSKYVEVAPFIKMMNAKVAYARGRGHVDECFEQMFSHLVRQISDVDSLKHAKLFMEAFMGFYKAQEKN